MSIKFKIIWYVNKIWYNKVSLDTNFNESWYDLIETNKIISNSKTLMRFD